MNGKIIVIDGADGVGKTTQANLLYEKLKKNNEKVLLLSFPKYENESSSLVKMYLNGGISDNINDINVYAASSFYTADRYISFKCEWEKYYNDGYVIICNRYVSSNLIHQMTRLEEKEWVSFKDWLYDYEYNKMGIPKPDKIIYLNLKREIADRLIEQRCIKDNVKKDIHELDKEYLKKCAEFSIKIGKKENWSIVNCFSDNTILDIETINEKILTIVREVI